MRKSLDFLHILNRALFDLHQTPNLDSNDRKFHCDSPLEYDFEQCTVAVNMVVISLRTLSENDAKYSQANI
jgi:hypothetical protein